MAAPSSTLLNSLGDANYSSDDPEPAHSHPHPHPQDQDQDRDPSTFMLLSRSIRTKIENLSGRATVTIVLALFLVLVSALWLGGFTSSKTSLDDTMGPPITHMLFVSWKASTSPETILKLSKQLVALKDSCLHPDTGKPYLLGGSGGINNSPFGSKMGYTHGFTLQFAGEEDRKYFLEKDPAHIAFASAMDEGKEKFLAIDFTPGVYE